MPVFAFFWGKIGDFSRNNHFSVAFLLEFDVIKEPIVRGLQDFLVKFAQFY